MEVYVDTELRSKVLLTSGPLRILHELQRNVSEERHQTACYVHSGNNHLAIADRRMMNLGIGRR